MKKKFNFGRLGALALALTLITTCLTGGTLAKYTSSVEGEGTATVAKWAFKAGDAVNGTTITDFHLTDTTTGGGVTDGKIAPGTEGKLPIFVDLTGTEVATKVTISVKVDDVSNLPEQLTFTDSDGKKVIMPTQDNTEKEIFTKELKASEAAAFKKELSINWEWLFDNSKDTEDTNLGATPPTSANITVKVTGEQLNEDPTVPPTP
ncbi:MULTISPECIES: hypothetical protein [Clostridia]|uniref:hypothetical protein n=1 Tax=Clostridia TaxID=186801 RepID=UPI00067EB734|nr:MULTISPECIES: hypothetical protein [Clostridia]